MHVNKSTTSSSHSQAISSLKMTDCSVFNNIISLRSAFPKVQVSLELLSKEGARANGQPLCDRTTTGRIVNGLEQIGLIKILRSKPTKRLDGSIRADAHQYSLNPILFNYSFRMKYKHLLPALAMGVLSIPMLFSINYNQYYATVVRLNIPARERESNYNTGYVNNTRALSRKSHGKYEQEDKALEFINEFMSMKHQRYFKYPESDDNREFLRQFGIT